MEAGTTWESTEKGNKNTIRQEEINTQHAILVSHLTITLHQLVRNQGYLHTGRVDVIN